MIELNNVSGRSLLIHWGRTGGGTLFHKNLAAAASPLGALTSHNPDSDQAAAMGDIPGPRLLVRTYRSPLGVVLGLPRLLVNAIRLRAFIRRNGVTHVVSTMGSVYQSVAVPLVLPRDVRYTTIIHDAVAHPGDEHFLKRVGRRLELARADDVVVLSQTVGADLLKSSSLRPERLRVLFHPAYGSVRPGPRTLGSSQPVVGMFGRLLPYKGVDLFRDAVIALRGRGVDLRAVVHGDGPEGRLQLEPGGEALEWHVGWIPEDRVDEIIDTFDVLAVTYREASQSGVVAHAIAHGVPVVGTPVGGLAEQITETRSGIVAERVDAESVADAIQRVLADGPTYEAMSSAAIATAAELTWERLAEGLLVVEPPRSDGG